MFRFILVMSMIFVFAVPAMAVEPNAAPAGEDASESQIEPRYPGRCAIKQVRVYAADTKQKIRYMDAISVGYPEHDQLCNVTIDSETKAVFSKHNADGWLVEILVNPQGANLATLKVNGSTVGTTAVPTNSSSATFSFVTSDFSRSLPWQIYFSDGTGRDKVVWGTIYK
ncbi:hypothetical protein C814_02820 [Anaerotruncus sp. G3(2012)]|uniref:hypothetical protein n=1 Tax=Anaerotruncus sp. G3(2012) TaxID=1235835 RepID=UPI0003370820|nr:hypothetical protein [Anaerotruncus sp. G3(2012)]EOS56415.1 hypothetical protein C814_02820 [Anaerotruncus sp. G3(2012)]